MATRTTTATRRYCPACAMHDHSRCTGMAPALGGTCECGDRAHNPDVETAATMRLYERPDLAAARLPVEELASSWHRKDEGR